jgi:hypothetical protein
MFPVFARRPADGSQEVPGRPATAARQTAGYRSRCRGGLPGKARGNGAGPRGKTRSAAVTAPLPKLIVRVRFSSPAPRVPAQLRADMQSQWLDQCHDDHLRVCWSGDIYQSLQSARSARSAMQRRLVLSVWPGAFHDPDLLPPGSEPSHTRWHSHARWNRRAPSSRARENPG